MTLLAIFEALVGANAIWETTVDWVHIKIWQNTINIINEKDYVNVLDTDHETNKIFV